MSLVLLEGAYLRINGDLDIVDAEVFIVNLQLFFCAAAAAALLLIGQWVANPRI